MEQVLYNYIAYLEAERGASDYTVRNYTTDLASFFDFFQAEKLVSLADVDRMVLRRYLSWLHDKGLVKASIARKLSALRSFYRYLKRENLIPTDPTAAVSSPKLDKRLPAFLSIEEMKRLLQAPDLATPQGQRDRALLELLYASGLRVSEIVQLTMEQVDFYSREIRVWGKGSKERVVLMGAPAAQALQTYLRQGRQQLLGEKKSNVLFVNRYGGRLAVRRVQLLVDSYARKAGLNKKVHPHVLRHTFATHLLDGGADLRTVQELLGHANLAATQIYTHVSQTQARKVYMAAHPGARQAPLNDENKES